MSKPLLAVLFCLSLAIPMLAQTSQLTARQVIERIQKNVGVPWTTPTVDTIKAGSADTPVTGIAVTMMATQDVLERAAASGKNFVITHEPTFYNHLDNTTDLEKNDDAVLRAKQQFIKEHNLVIWRFHDHWHARKPDGILAGMTRALAWEEFQKAENEHLFVIPQTTLAGLGEQLKEKLKIRVPRVVGDPQLKVTEIAFLPGAAGSARQIQMLERADVEVLLIGETPEWETVEYVADAVTQQKRKALVILGHIPSEQAGMEECTQWLKSFISEAPIEFIPAKEPFWPPK